MVHSGIFSIFLVFVFVFVLHPPWGLPTGSEALPAGSEEISLSGDAIGHCPLWGRCPLSAKLTE